jgi:hypothetical protein
MRWLSFVLCVSLAAATSGALADHPTSRNGYPLAGLAVERPKAPPIGHTYHSTDTQIWELYTAVGWKNLADRIPTAFQPGGLRTPDQISRVRGRGLRMWYESDGDVQPKGAAASTDLFKDTKCSTAATTNGDVVKGWKNRGPFGGNLTNPSPSNLTAAMPVNIFKDFPGGRGGLLGAGSGSATWLHAAKASDWSWMHQGASTVFCLFRPTASSTGSCIYDTGAIGGVGAGIGLYYQSSSTSNSSITAVISGIADSRKNRFTLFTVAGDNLVPQNSLVLVAVDWNGEATNGIARLFVNNSLAKILQVSGAASTATAQSAFHIMDSGEHGRPFNGQIFSVIGYDRLLNDSERREVTTYLCARYQHSAGSIALIGDSVLVGTNVIGTGINVATPAERLEQSLGPLWQATVFGASGISVNTAKKNYFEAFAYRKRWNYYVVMVGLKDLFNGDSAATVWGRGGGSFSSAGVWTTGDGKMKDFLDELTADSSTRVIACTVVPTKGFSGWTGGWDRAKQAQVDAYNAYLKAYMPYNGNGNYWCADTYTALLDPDRPYMQRANCTFDNGHPNQYGVDLLIQPIAWQLQSLGP